MSKEKELKSDLDLITKTQKELNRMKRLFKKSLRDSKCYVDDNKEIKKKEFVYCIESRIDRLHINGSTILNKDKALEPIFTHTLHHTIEELTNDDLELILKMLSYTFDYDREEDLEKISNQVYDEIKYLCKTERDIYILSLLVDSNYLLINALELNDRHTFYNADTGKYSYLYNIKPNGRELKENMLLSGSYIKIYETSKDVLDKFELEETEINKQLFQKPIW